MAIPCISAYTYWLISPSEDTASQITPHIETALYSLGSVIPFVSACTRTSSQNVTTSRSTEDITKSAIFNRLRRENKYLQKAESRMYVVDMDRDDASWKKELYQCHAPYHVSRATSRVIWDYANSDENEIVPREQQAPIVSEIRKQLESRVKLINQHKCKTELSPRLAAFIAGEPTINIRFTKEKRNDLIATNNRVAFFSAPKKTLDQKYTEIPRYITININQRTFGDNTASSSQRIFKKEDIFEHEITHLIQKIYDECLIRTPLEEMLGANYNDNSLCNSCDDSHEKYDIPQSLYNIIHDAETEQELKKLSISWERANPIRPYAKRLMAKIYARVSYWSSLYYPSLVAQNALKSSETAKQLLQDIQDEIHETSPTEMDASLAELSYHLSHQQYRYFLEQLGENLDNWIKDIIVGVTQDSQNARLKLELIRKGYISELFIHFQEQNTQQS